MIIWIRKKHFGCGQEMINNKDNYPDPKKYLVGIYTSNQNLIPMEEMNFEDDFDINTLIKELEEENIE